MEGFITIHRRILEWEWYSDANVMRVFIHCLLRANYQEHSWQGHLIARGQFVTSIKKLSQELELTPKQVSGALDKLKRTNEIEIKTSNKNTTITICKYDDYQAMDCAEGKTKGKAEGETNGNQRENKGKQINKENNNNNITINKNNTPNGDIVKKDAFDFRQVLIDTYNVPADVVDTWLVVRKKRKANNSKLALDALVREASRAGLSVAEAVRMAAERSWQSFQATYIREPHDNRQQLFPAPDPINDTERQRMENEIRKQRAEAARRQAEREEKEAADAERQRIERLNAITGTEYQPTNNN